MPPPAKAPPARGRRGKRPSGDERERALRETLAVLLKTSAFHEISIDDLARGAGISRPNFYFYFGSKEAVLLSLMDEIVRAADGASEAAQAALAADPPRFLHDALAAYVAIFGANRAVIVACDQAASTSPQVRRLWNEVRERWVQTAAGAITAVRESAGLGGELSARELAIALLGMNEAVMFAAFAGEDPAIAEARVTDVLTNIWVNAVYAGTQPPT